MELITSIEAMRSLSASWRRQHRLAIVPTLGNIHRAHLALLKRAAQLADKVVVSIFLNPLQFDNQEDFLNYPRTAEQDCERLRRHAADAVFMPERDEMCPDDEDQTISVDVGRLGTILCGAARPRHFNGVATALMKIFHIVQADLAVFGEKDYQQLCIIRQMVRRFNVPVKIVSHPTVREDDGLALSSRNAYLTAEQRKKAGFLYRTLLSARQKLQAGGAAEDIEKEALAQLSDRGWRPGYFSVRSASDLSKADAGSEKLIIAAAAFLGKARLIDNVPVAMKALKPSGRD